MAKKEMEERTKANDTITFEKQMMSRPVQSF
jgi:hypothetical protein